MSSVVIYDSAFGNTEKVARAVAAVLGEVGDCRLVPVGEARPADVSDAALLVIASPTQAFNALPSVNHFIGSLTDDVLANKAVAVFDTRIALEDIPSAPLRWAVKVGGFAADHMAKHLRSRHAKLVLEPEGFCVGDKEGPLKPGELDRAVAWAHELAAAVTPTGAAA